MNLGKLILRLVLGGLLFGHGMQKLRGSFGGPGLGGVDKMMESMDMVPARRNALAASLSETVGGAAIAVGAGTPFAAAAIVATMVTAIRKVHLKNGVWSSGGGYEYNAVIIAALAAIVDDGPGTISFDAIIGKSRWGALWAVAALGAGAVGSTLAIEAGKRAAAEKASAVEATDAAI